MLGLSGLSLEKSCWYIIMYMRAHLLVEELLEGASVHLRGCLHAGNVQEGRRQVDVQHYVVYSATVQFDPLHLWIPRN